MKKLYNRALMYQAFEKTKWILLVCSFVFFMCCYFMINSKLDKVSSYISNLSTNVLSYTDIWIVILVCCLIFLIHIIITGNNKQEYRNFLGCGPFTKEDIKKNEILFLFIVLGICVIIFAYINICLYFRNEYLIEITSEYFRVLIEDTIRILVIGTMFIAYLLLIELLFANTTFCSLMIILTPLVFLFNIIILLEMKDYMNTVNIITGKLRMYIDKCLLAIENYFFRNHDNMFFNIKYEITAIAIILLIAIIGFIIMWQINKRMNCNRSNKLFTFPFVENTFSYVFSFSVVNFIMFIVIDKIYNKSYLYYQERVPKMINNIHFYGIIIFIIAISFVIMKPVKKIVKKFI